MEKTTKVIKTTQCLEEATTKKTHDALYFKTYYEQKLKNVSFLCNACNCVVHTTHKSRHIKTKKHLNICEKYMLGPLANVYSPLPIN